MLGLTAKSFGTPGTPGPRLQVPVWQLMRTDPIKTHRCSFHHKNPIRRLHKKIWKRETARKMRKKTLKEIKECPERVMVPQLQLALSRNLDRTLRVAQGTTGVPCPPACCPSGRHSHEPKVRGQSIWKEPFKGGPVWCPEGSHWVQKKWLMGRSERPMGYFVYTKGRLQWADVIVTGMVCFPLREFFSSGRGYALDLCLSLQCNSQPCPWSSESPTFVKGRNSVSLPDGLLIRKLENGLLFSIFFLDTFKSTWKGGDLVLFSNRKK